MGAMSRSNTCVAEVTVLRSRQVTRETTPVWMTYPSRIYLPAALGLFLALIYHDLVISLFFIVIGVGITWYLTRRLHIAQRLKDDTQVLELVIAFRGIFKVRPAIFAALEFGAELGRMAFIGIGDPAVRTLAGCVAIFIGVLVVMVLVRLVVHSMVKALGLSVSDRLLGMVFGLLRGALICMTLVALGGMTSAPTQAWWRSAVLAPPLEKAVLAVKPWLPDDLAKRIRFS